MTWIIHRNDPGPLTYFEGHHGYWYILVGDSTQIAANVLADALIVSGFNFPIFDALLCTECQQ
jgi:hypothetical protein